MLTKAEIAFIRSLSSRRERAASGLFVAEGEKSVREMLASSFPVRRVFAVGDGAEWLPLRADTELVRVSPKEMERISMLKTPAGVLALVEIPHYAQPERFGDGALVLALDDVQDPGNMGTIVRLADWFGIRDIVCSEATADCFNPKVVQATMGAFPAAVRSAGEGAVGRHSGLRHFPGRGRHLRRGALCGRDSGDGKRGERNRPGCGKMRVPPPVHSVLSRRNGYFRVVERRRGYGRGLRRIPPQVALIRAVRSCSGTGWRSRPELRILSGNGSAEKSLRRIAGCW